MVLIAWVRFSKDPDGATRSLLAEQASESVFLFDGSDLVDCTPQAQRIADGWATGGTDLQRLCRAFSARFVGLPGPETLARNGFQGTFAPRDPNDAMRAHFDVWNGMVRVRLKGRGESDMPGEGPQIDPITLAAHEAELETLRGVTNTSPVLMWQIGVNGDIEWTNEAYAQMIRDVTQDDVMRWPPRDLFPAVSGGADGTNRISLAQMSGEDLWFDVTSTRHPSGTRQCFAIDAAPVIRAERAQRDTVQTLTKTFAQLSVGLAIFDRKRQLTLFNPALLDLLEVPVDVLSSKPTLTRFLDTLRDRKLIAEPRDYHSWRQRIAELEDAALQGTYCEVWPLPGGGTFRVTGRPHADGAIAFLFEDISAELSLTRRFHSQIAMGQAVLDTLDDAVAVFSPMGVLTLSNAAYARLWDRDPSAEVAEQSMQDAVGFWERATEPDPMWRSLLAVLQQRKTGPGGWAGETVMRDGRRLTCNLRRLEGGATLVRFNASAPLVSAAHTLAARRKALAAAG
ncbi:MAG: PAS-domain containing protein [Pseudomonadota bacterium]